MGTTEETERLVIAGERQLFDDPPFFVLRTEGWSVDRAEELRILLDKIEQFMACTKWSEKKGDKDR